MDLPGPYAGGGRSLSLLDGWLPWTVQAVVLALVLVVAVRRDRGLAALRVPVAVVLGVVGAVVAWLTFRDSGLASDPAPVLVWTWVGILVAAVVLVFLGWSGARWWRRLLSVLLVPLCLLCVGLVLNEWVGYLTTVPEAWATVTAGPVPDQVAADQLPALQGTGASLTTGRVVEVDIPSTGSGFAHRDEYVYLPPVWFTGPTHPALPVLMMIAGEFNTPADWMRTGNVIPVVDQYARTHGGRAPILVFVDAGGTFNNDTECVDGPRGNAADHLTRDVPSFVEKTYGASADPRQWGVVGWSMGGTCAVDLAVMHPELIDTFDDIAGDAGPEVGTKQQTIDRLYGGDAAAWARFDPATVLAGHAPYADTAGRFDDSGDTGRPPGTRPGRPGSPPGGPAGRARGNAPDAGLGGRGGNGADGQELPAARSLCAQAGTRHIACTVRTLPGRHSWQFATTAFTDDLPWMSERLFGAGAVASAADR